jgi:hypothetical protein
MGDGARECCADLGTRGAGHAWLMTSKTRRRGSPRKHRKYREHKVSVTRVMEAAFANFCAVGRSGFDMHS